MTTQSQDSTDDEIKSQVLPNLVLWGQTTKPSIKYCTKSVSRIFGLHIWPDVSGASIPALSPHLSKRNGVSSGTGQVLVAGRISEAALYSAAQIYPATYCILQYRINVSYLVIPRYRFCGRPRILLSDNQQRRFSPQHKLRASLAPLWPVGRRSIACMRRLVGSVVRMEV